MICHSKWLIDSVGGLYLYIFRKCNVIGTHPIVDTYKCIFVIIVKSAIMSNAQ